MRDIKHRRRLCAAMLFIPLFFNTAYAQESGQIYSLAVSEARSGNTDSAFLYLRSLLDDFPGSKYAPDALFASGEYYFSIADYADSIKAFARYLNDYPDSPGMIFAFMYLLKIAENRGDESSAQNLRKKIITLKQVSFLFRESKVYKYRSALYRKHKAAYYIDRVEFHIDGELFAKISY